MSNCRWSWGMLGTLVMSGCGANVDLGQVEVEVTSASEAVGSELRAFAPTQWGMCANFENERTYCWGWQGGRRARHLANLDGVRLASATQAEQICVAHADGQVGCTNDYREPVRGLLGIEGATELSVGAGAGCALRADGTLQRWPSLEAACPPPLEPLELPSPAAEIVCPQETIGGCVVTKDGRLFCFDVERGEGCGQMKQVPGIDDAVQVALTMEQLCLLRRGGTVSCALLTHPGEVGTFEPLPEIERAIELRSSRVATCALERTGQLKCWGLSYCGSLGIAEDCGSTKVQVPLVVQQDIQTRRFGMSDGLLCSEDAAGRVWCWGFSGWDGRALGSPLPRPIAF